MRFREPSNNNLEMLLGMVHPTPTPPATPRTGARRRRIQNSNQYAQEITGNRYNSRLAGPASGIGWLVV